MAERSCHLPSFPIVALVGLAGAVAIERTRARPGWHAAVMAGFAFLVASAPWQRSGATPIGTTSTLSHQDPVAEPIGVLLWSNLATYHFAGAGQEGARALERAAAIDRENSGFARPARSDAVRGRHAEAIPIEQVIAAEAEHGRAPALNDLADLHRVTGREDQALEILEGLVADGTADATSTQSRRVHRHRQHPQQAREYDRLAFEERPDPTHRHRVGGLRARRRTAGGRAERIDRALLAMHLDDPRVLNNWR